MGFLPWLYWSLRIQTLSEKVHEPLYLWKTCSHRLGQVKIFFFSFFYRFGHHFIYHCFSFMFSFIFFLSFYFSFFIIFFIFLSFFLSFFLPVVQKKSKCWSARVQFQVEVRLWSYSYRVQPQYIQYVYIYMIIIYYIYILHIYYYIYICMGFLPWLYWSLRIQTLSEKVLKPLYFCPDRRTLPKKVLGSIGTYIPHRIQVSS